jgi:hypothetical protein
MSALRPSGSPIFISSKGAFFTDLKRQKVAPPQDDLFTTSLLSYLGDLRLSRVCKKWQALQIIAYRLIFNSLQTRAILIDYVDKIPVRLSFPINRIRFIYGLVKQKAVQYRLKPSDFLNCGISHLNLDGILLKIELFRKELFERLHGIHLAPVINVLGVKTPLSGLSSNSSLLEIEFRFTREVVKTQILLQRLLGRRSLFDPRLDRLEARRDVLKARLRLIKQSAALAKKAAISSHI